MAPSTIRKAIGAVKDQTSIGIVMVASNMAPELKVAVVKATSHDDDPASEKYVGQILHFTSYSRGHVSACVSAVSKRLSKTRDWIVALKCLMLVHRLLNHGDPAFLHDLMYATRRGARLLNLSHFRDEAHSSSWDHSSFVRTYALYLDQKLEFLAQRSRTGDRAQVERSFCSPPESSRGYGYRLDEFREGPNSGIHRSRSSGDVPDSSGQEKEQAPTIPLRDMQPEQILGKMGHLHRLVDRFLACKPTGLAVNERMILVALYAIVKESFKLYADVCEVLAVLLDKFFDMEYQDCVKTLDAYVVSSKQIDELVFFYKWCKDISVARPSEYPEVQRITSKLLETLEEFVRDRAKAMKSPERKREPEKVEEEPAPDMNELKALPAPELDNSSEPEPGPDPFKLEVQQMGDLLDLRPDEGVTADDHGNKLALALFAGPTVASNDENGAAVTSAWQNPAAEGGRADWEVALVESVSHLSKQKAAMGGGLSPLLLNGMYDQGVVGQHTSAAQLGGGSASSVALPGLGKVAVLALPSLDGSVQSVGEDPFVASLSIPPPSYVQMADMEKKQQLLVQEQVVWQHYAVEGMRGQASLAKISTGGFYGMPTPLNGGVPPARYY